jgi:hypothetical protein
VEFILQVKPETARALSGEGPWNESARCVREALDSLHASAKPLHPGVRDESMLSFLRVFAPENVSRIQVVEKLSACPGVQAAYEKPAGEAPRF